MWNLVRLPLSEGIAAALKALGFCTLILVVLALFLATSSTPLVHVDDLFDRSAFKVDAEAERVFYETHQQDRPGGKVHLVFKSPTITVPKFGIDVVASLLFRASYELKPRVSGVSIDRNSLIWDMLVLNQSDELYILKEWHCLPLLGLLPMFCYVRETVPFRLPELNVSSLANAASALPDNITCWDNCILRKTSSTKEDCKCSEEAALFVCHNTPVWPKVPMSAVGIAISRNRVLARDILDKMKDEEWKKPVVCPDWNVAHYAAYRGDKEIAELAVRRMPILLNATDNSSRTPLAVAVHYMERAVGKTRDGFQAVIDIYQRLLNNEL